MNNKINTMIKQFITNERLKKIIYNSGDLFLPPSIKKVLDKDIIGSRKNTFYFSGWSIMHFISGIITGYIYLLYTNKPQNTNKYYYSMFIIHTIWELWQILIGMSNPLNITGHNNIVDIISDTIYFMLGCYLVIKTIV